MRKFPLLAATGILLLGIGTGLSMWGQYVRSQVRLPMTVASSQDTADPKNTIALSSSPIAETPALSAPVDFSSGWRQVRSGTVGGYVTGDGQILVGGTRLYTVEDTISHQCFVIVENERGIGITLAPLACVPSKAGR